MNPTRPALAAVVTYQDTRYLLHAGRVVLDWRTHRVLHHRKGCLLCCDVRVSARVGAPARHPGDCRNCGPRYRGPRPDPCRFCRVTAHLLDEHGRPTHKACLELAITAEVLRRAAVVTPSLTLDAWKDAA
ncbi:hypothetical protein Aple_051110 [Acrocarpospora pleiomorpha]|uniref:Uncharacterized protein n=1 Tax=Acrocarpospora pleiomorpha TaxID=90975 RepID=A0A5M3XLT7_9ACTN|nr:hypothetical protein [Acrocarpospora pleiomorpha]GES22214.1 hypothetical protein Aple_051110 [Acrocarpospora pleiomorpha]